MENAAVFCHFAFFAFIVSVLFGRSGGKMSELVNRVAKRKRGDAQDGAEGHQLEAMEESTALVLYNNINDWGNFKTRNVDDFILAARFMWKAKDPLRENIPSAEENKDFVEMFGIPPDTVCALWNKLLETDLLPEGGKTEHLMWALCFMKTYVKAKVLSTLCGGADKKTVRKWVWAFINAISDLEADYIVWENRKKGDTQEDCLVTVDGTDFRIPNQAGALYKLFASHKYKMKSGLRYEVALCIKTGDIVWINGPFPCGAFPDITIFRDSLIHDLDDGERVEADDGYVGEHPQHVKCPNGFANPQITLFMQQRVRNRQESVNNRFKFWGILQQVFRHDIERHGDVFRAIAVITQLQINLGSRLFHCGYRDPPYQEQA